MKNNAGGIWFSAKRAAIARSSFAKEINETIKYKAHVLRRIRENSALNADVDVQARMFGIVKPSEKQEDLKK
jgi:hypothetical protein